MIDAALDEISRVIECLLFVAGEPVGTRELAKAAETDEAAIHQAIQGLRARYENSGLQIIEIAGGYQIGTRARYAPFVGRYLAPRANKLSRPALETVTIVAYRQPCTQAEVEVVRGVSVDGVLKTLLERELVREAGRKPVAGRPILYATTDAFLHYFGLASLADLPALDADDTPERDEKQQEANTALHAAGIN